MTGERALIERFRGMQQEREHYRGGTGEIGARLSVDAPHSLQIARVNHELQMEIPVVLACDRRFRS